MKTAEIITQRVAMQQVVERYGFKPNRAGYISCPFHNEKTASLKIFPNNRGWHCFGCNQGGSVIDFVMKLFNVSFRQALIRINSDFGLNLTNERPDPQKLAEERKRRAELERAKAIQQAEYKQKETEFIRLWSARQDKAPKNTTETWDTEFCEALQRLSYLEYWFEDRGC